MLPARVAKLRQFTLRRGELLGVLGLLANSLLEASKFTLVLTDALVALPQLLTEMIDV